MLKFLLVVALVAVAVYLLVRAVQRRGGGGGLGALPTRAPRPPRPRAVAPDDDEDFLRDLDRRKPHHEDDEGESR